MQDAVRQQALRESRKALDLMAKSELSRDEQEAVVSDCLANFDKYVNPGILEYRKSCSTDYTAVEWRDEGNVFYDIHGKEFIDCLGGFGIYVLGHRHPTVVKAVMDQLQHQALHSQELLDPMRGYASELLGMVTPGELQYSFFCNSGTEANRGRAEAGEAAREAQEGQPHQRHHQLSGRLSRQVVRQPERDRQGRLARALLPAGAQRALRPLRGRRRARQGAQGLRRDRARHRRVHRRTRPGRGRRPRPSRRLLPQGPRDLRQVGRPAHRGRGADRHGPHGHTVGRRPLGRRSRHHDHGQGAGRRRHPRRLLHLHA